MPGRGTRDAARVPAAFHVPRAAFRQSSADNLVEGRVRKPGTKGPEVVPGLWVVLHRVGTDQAAIIANIEAIVGLAEGDVLLLAGSLSEDLGTSKSDLDLILTSPVCPRKIFSVRIGRIAVEVALLAMLLAAPAIDVLAVLGEVAQEP